MNRMDEGISASLGEDFATSPVFLLSPSVAAARLYCDGRRGAGMFSLLFVSLLEIVGISGSSKFLAALGALSKLCASSAGTL